MGKIAFDEHSEKYDGWFMMNQNILASEVLLIKEALRDPGHALSVGCGSGLFEHFLRTDHGVEIKHGVEPSEAMAAIARKRGMTVEIAPAENVPFKDASFDTVLMNGIPAYVRDVRTALQEARRLLKPGGRLVIGDVPASSSYGMLYQLAARIGTWHDPQLRKIAPKDPYPVEFVKEASWRTTEEISEILRALAFRNIEYLQTLTTHARFANDAVEEPSAGFERGSYVAIGAVK